MAQNKPEKKTPSMIANAMHRSVNDAHVRSVQVNAHWALRLTVAMLLMPVRVSDEGVNKERVCCKVDIFHHDLKPLEKASRGRLDFRGKIFGKIFANDSVGTRKKGQDMLEEVPF